MDHLETELRNADEGKAMTLLAATLASWTVVIVAAISIWTSIGPAPVLPMPEGIEDARTAAVDHEALALLPEMARPTQHQARQLELLLWQARQTVVELRHEAEVEHTGQWLFGAVGGFGLLPLGALLRVRRTRPIAVELGARWLTIGSERYLLEEPDEVAAALERLRSGVVDPAVVAAVERAHARLREAPLPAASQRRALEAMRS